MLISIFPKVWKIWKFKKIYWSHAFLFLFCLTLYNFQNDWNCPIFQLKVCLTFDNLILQILPLSRLVQRVEGEKINLIKKKVLTKTYIIIIRIFGASFIFCKEKLSRPKNWTFLWELTFGSATKWNISQITELCFAKISYF